MENAHSVIRGKRKQKQVETDVKMKKKKSKRDQMDVDGNDAAVFHKLYIYWELFDSTQYLLLRKPTFKSNGCL